MMMMKTTTMTMITAKQRSRINRGVDDEEAAAGKEKGGVDNILDD